jgi:hypothetical protein
MSKRAAESPAAGPDGKRHHGHELGSRDGEWNDLAIGQLRDTLRTD